MITDWGKNIYDYKRNVMCIDWILVTEFCENPASL